MKKFVVLMLTICLAYGIKAQLTVSTVGNPTQWVQNVLVGNGVTVSNVVYTGDPQSLGVFSTGPTPTSLGFTDGLIMSSGNVADAPGPNGSGSTGTNTSGVSDPQLASLITQSINDAAVLEFDFVPLSDTIQFQYIFSSEEYPEFSVSSFNDVFGFFLTGINPSGPQYNNTNIALLPGSTTVVSINNVNNGNTNSGPCVNCAYYDHNYGQTIEYDASTVILTAWAKVIPCISYHIKLAVGDAQDEIYDSAVFLKANSFSSKNVMLSQTASNLADTTASEGCTDTHVKFKIPYITPVDLDVYFLTSGSATNGVDYTTINSPVTIPAGTDSVMLTIHPILDGITEGTEQIIFNVATSPCTTDTIIVYINDRDSIAVDVLNDTVLCGNVSDTIWALASGLIGPYSYQWSTGAGDTLDYLVVNPATTTTYTVTVQGKCVDDTSGSVVVQVSDPVFTMDGDSICPGDTANISVLSNMALTYQWQTGETTASISPPAPSTQYYTVLVSDTIGCEKLDSAQVHVFPSPNVQISNDKYICNGSSTVLIASGGTQYAWSSGQSTSDITVSPTSDQTYIVTVMNSGNCSGYDTVDVYVIDRPVAEITASLDTVCKGGSVDLTASGGMSYLWPKEGTTSPTVTVTPNGSTTTTVLAINSDGGTNCSDTAEIFIPVIRCNRIYFPSAFSPNNDGRNDEFRIAGVYPYLDNYEMSIYDRYGKVVFYTKDPDATWDGRIDKNKPVVGVYTYVVVVKEAFMDPYIIRGTITLVL